MNSHVDTLSDVELTCRARVGFQHGLSNIKLQEAMFFHAFIK